MKLILLAIFIIIYFNAISSKTIRIKDIYKRSNSYRHSQRSAAFFLPIGPPTHQKTNSHAYSLCPPKKCKNLNKP